MPDTTAGSAARDTDIHLSCRPLAAAEANLGHLAAQVRHDLDVLSHPSAEWLRPVTVASGAHVFDVVIVGAGQAGLIVGLALKRDGIRNVLLLDRNPAGYEGRGNSAAIFFGTIFFVAAIGAFFPLLFGREPVGQLETVSEAAPALA